MWQVWRGFIALVGALLIAGCGGGGSGGNGTPGPGATSTPAPTPTPPPAGVKAKVSRIVLPGVFDDTTFSLSKWPQVSGANCTLYVADLHGTSGVSVVVGGVSCPISEILNPGGGDARIAFTLPVRSSAGGAVPQGTHTVRVVDTAGEADQPSPPIQVTIAP